jgi:hypothetical protein
VKTYLTPDDLTERGLSAEKVARLTPLCPTCGEPLIARATNRRFIEANGNAECLNGHVFNLVPIRVNLDLRGVST